MKSIEIIILMKKIIIMCIALVMASSTLSAYEKMNLKDIAEGQFAAQRIDGINPIKGTDQYAQLSRDGKQIVQYSFKTGKQTAVLFDVNNTQGERVDQFDGYIISPDGRYILIATQRQAVYRRSFKAVYYIYTVQSWNAFQTADLNRLRYGRLMAIRWHL